MHRRAAGAPAESERLSVLFQLQGGNSPRGHNITVARIVANNVVLVIFLTMYISSFQLKSQMMAWASVRAILPGIGVPWDATNKPGC